MNEQYNKIKKEMENITFPIRKVNLADIMHRGENVYNIEGEDFTLRNYVKNSIDKALGISATQRHCICKNSGERELSKMRNYFFAKNSNKNVMLFAGANNQIVRIEDKVEGIVPPSAFFSIVELFCDNNDYQIQSIVKSTYNPYELSVNLKSSVDKIVPITDGDNLITNNFSFTWDLTSIDFNERILRQVCTNGAMALSEKTLRTVKDVQTENFTKLAYLTDTLMEKVAERIDNYLETSKQALRSYASLWELQKVANILMNNGLGEDNVNSLTGFFDIKKGIMDRDKKLLQNKHSARIKTHKTVWELYNLLTYISSHKIDDYEIASHKALNLEASKFLKAKRDIVDYIDLDDVG